MINSAIVNQKVYAVIRKYLKSEAVIIWEKQAQARPPKPFCTLNFITGPVRIAHDIERVHPDQVIEIAGVRELTLSINYFGENAMQELGYVQTCFGFPTARELLLQAGLVFVTETAPRDLSSLMENKFETRAQMDVRFRINGSMKDEDREIIEAVVLENEIDNTTTTISSP